MDEASHVVINLIFLPIRLLWNIAVIVGSIWLEVTWICFLFGSVVGVVIVLIFAPELFLMPLGLMVFITKLWPRSHD